MVAHSLVPVTVGDHRGRFHAGDIGAHVPVGVLPLDVDHYGAAGRKDADETSV